VIKYLKRISHAIVIAAALFFLPLFLLNISADEIEGKPKEAAELSEIEEGTVKDMQAAQEGENFRNEIDSYIRYIPSNTSSPRGSRIQITQAGVEYDYNFKAFGKLPVELSLNPEYININNSTAVDLPAHLTNLSFGFNTTLPLFNIPKTYLYVELDPSFYGDNWDLHASKFSFEGNCNIIYKLTEKLSLIAGIQIDPVYRYPFFGDLHLYPVSPVIGFIYKPNEKLLFNILPDTPTISYFLNDKVTLFLQESDSHERYNVTRDGSRARLNYSQLFVSGGVKFKINKFIETSLALGDAVQQILKYPGSMGKVTARNGLFTEFRIEARI